jgi:hypothetical protein
LKDKAPSHTIFTQNLQLFAVIFTLKKYNASGNIFLRNRRRFMGRGTLIESPRRNSAVWECGILDIASDFSFFYAVISLPGG